ncbi:hypothetical protein [Paenibacillus sp. Leaf72]|uniref:hypothetical protein n=1 Tax=Paenibacillus sp. Leaf72 TaxID=1736234 RepID=UPI0006F81ADF|nr:hypothetical protein [Paenibacillus sp. Leaf72]KQO17531.1 hypothetical protein ASF12_02260 [Paenibacillus sp. Leaf72]
MFWTAVWFIVNMFFVTSLILFLFMQRSYTLAKLESGNGDKLRKAHKIRLTFGIISLILFVAMVASFLINMRLNG